MTPAKVHPSALVESDAVGDGTRVWAFAHVMAGATIGRDCNVCDHVFVETGAVVGDRVTLKNRALVWTGVTIEDDVFVGPAVTFTNDRFPRAGRGAKEADWLSPTIVRAGASIGAGCTIVCGITIGRLAMVGAASVVTSDVPPHALVRGHPARRVGWVCECGRPLSKALRCTCNRAYDLISENEGLRQR
jgi:acetyltransferase-like isoleucine patch superfamily enzyme